LVVFASNRTGRWQIYSFANGRVRRVSASSTDDTQPAVSPDGQRIAFVSGSPSAVWLMGVDGNHRYRLTDPPAGGCPAPPGYSSDCQDLHPRWSPDGRRIAFTRAGDADTLAGCRSTANQAPAYVPCPHVDVVTIATGHVADLGTGRNPDWSPDGSRLVFDDNYASAATSCPQCDQGDLYLMHPDGTGRTSLATPGKSARWSPDGRRLAYWHMVLQGNNVVFRLAVFTVASATSQDVPSFTGPTGDVGAPNWTIGGDSLLVAAPANGYVALAYVQPGTGRTRPLNTGRSATANDIDPEVHD
jgi:Tol biopolymer transport system component